MSHDGTPLNGLPERIVNQAQRGKKKPVEQPDVPPVEQGVLSEDSEDYKRERQKSAGFLEEWKARTAREPLRGDIAQQVEEYKSKPLSAGDVKLLRFLRDHKDALPLLRVPKELWPLHVLMSLQLRQLIYGLPYLPPYAERAEEELLRCLTRDDEKLCIGLSIPNGIDVAGNLADPAPSLLPADKHNDDKAIEHSADFSSVRWGNQVFSFTSKQADAVQVWHDGWKKGTPDLRDATVIERIGSDAENPSRALKDLFDGNGWGTMIVKGATKGTHRLADPPNSVKEI